MDTCMQPVLLQILVGGRYYMVGCPSLCLMKLLIIMVTKVSKLLAYKYL